jgi:hypothetical protein
MMILLPSEERRSEVISHRRSGDQLVNHVNTVPSRFFSRGTGAHRANPLDDLLVRYPHDHQPMLHSPVPKPARHVPRRASNRLLHWSTRHARLRLVVHQSPLVVGEDRDDVFRVWSERKVVELDVAEMQRALDLATRFLLPSAAVRRAVHP